MPGSSPMSSQRFRELKAGERSGDGRRADDALALLAVGGHRVQGHDAREEALKRRLVAVEEHAAAEQRRRDRHDDGERRVAAPGQRQGRRQQEDRSAGALTDGAGRRPDLVLRGTRQHRGQQPVGEMVGAGLERHSQPHARTVARPRARRIAIEADREISLVT
jgi:hypothetical protein